jgi:2-polyprenyl-3-methyl-5-hydroxy-6-metoxy-1,4-benzoquinol methylase
MLLTEKLLFGMAKLMYRSQLGHSDEMKDALESPESYAAYRSERAQVVLDAARTCGVELKQKVVVDFGCYDGAITPGYLKAGAARIYGVDIDSEAIVKAKSGGTDPRITFLESSVDRVPLDDCSADVILCYDVFEHVSRPEEILHECHRILRPGGQMLIGTWGWYHPFAPHLWSTMPVPWAHVFVSERTLLRTCRRVYNAPWYRPTMHDFDSEGNRRTDKFQEEEISTDYLNKLLVKDFENVFRKSQFEYTMRLQPFGSRYARWTRPLLKVPFIREFFTSYLWVTLTRPTGPHESRKAGTVPAAEVQGSL